MVLQVRFQPGSQVALGGYEHYWVKLASNASGVLTGTNSGWQLSAAASTSSHYYLLHRHILPLMLVSAIKQTLFVCDITQAMNHSPMHLYQLP